MTLIFEKITLFVGTWSPPPSPPSGMVPKEGGTKLDHTGLTSSVVPWLDAAKE
jgi:hypothetical protein